MLIGIKMKKNVTEVGHSEGLKIYVTLAFKSIQITYSLKPLHAPMVLKFRMQHDKAAGLQND